MLHILFQTILLSLCLIGFPHPTIHCPKTVSIEALVFLLAILIGVVRVAGGSGCFVCTWGSHAHRLARAFLLIEALQGSLPDIKCETGVNIVFLSLNKRKF